MSDLPFGVTIAPPPSELKLGDDNDREHFDWRSYNRPTVSVIQGAKTFPEPIAVDPTTQHFACSGSVDTRYYREATKFRFLSEMTWEEARIALNRLVAPLGYRATGKPADYVGLAAFALSAGENFVGRKGDHAGKFRLERPNAINRLRDHLSLRLNEADRLAVQLARPIAQHGANLSRGDHTVANELVAAFATALPLAGEQWVRLSIATPDEVITALNRLRTQWATWSAHRPAVAETVAGLNTADLPTAAAYAVALHIAEMLCFVGEKLTSLYAGIMFSMPIYRLYPATPEAEAIGLWWPWGRQAPLIAGPPPRPPKAVLDPTLITTKRPQDIVREVMQKTGINRTTAQAMTADLRRQLRSQRQVQAAMLLAQGITKAEVARRVGLSPSRISALFKEKYPPGRPKFRRAPGK
jgi:hypothetical protein